jgi:benzodiazapine receptor
MNRNRKAALIREGRFVAIAVIPVVATSAIGELATYPNLASWYSGLVKPSFNPPNWVFAPVWTMLYALMAFAVWRILRPRRRAAVQRLGVGLLFLQLGLNAAWPWMFFEAHSPVLGLLNIVPQLVIIVSTIALFLRLDILAALALVSLALWVAFANRAEFCNLFAERLI